MSDLKTTISDSFVQYAGAVLQNRALIDVRDGLKPSARQIFYSMLLHKLTADNPHKQTANAVGMALADFYIHGDSSCEGVIMRAAQPFAMRYPLVDVKGNSGSLIESGNWAAMRYTESRLSKLMGNLFTDINKDTISEWRDSYDNSKQYPAVLPSKGFYNIVNGTQGIGIGMAASVPQYNLKELNNALIYLIDHPDCDFDEIYCAPDFATGAILLNESEVKESMKNGQGFACKLRSVVEFDNKDRCFVVTEIPYGVYTNTICAELEKIIESEENPGVDRFNDLTGKTALLKIYLTKKANPDKVLQYLFKNTSLQSFFGINFTMLDRGRYPKVFTWKEMLQAHVDHEKEVYRRGFEFDLKKIEDRIHIIDGLLICLARIEEVVQTIKNSSSTAAASAALQSNFLLDEVQAKAVLDMKLSRLAHLEVKKLEDEREELLKEDARIREILNNESLFNNELKKGWTEVAAKFGDSRRTKIMNLSSDSNDEPIEIKSLQVSLTNKNTVITVESSSLYTQRRGGVGNKIKTDSSEYVVTTDSVQSNEELLFFTQKGNYYHCLASALPIGDRVALSNFIPIQDDEIVKTFLPISKMKKKSFIIFCTRNGLMKKSYLSEYSTLRNIGVKAIALDEGDEIVDVIYTDSDNVGVLTFNGNFIIVTTTDIRPIGRVARGIKAIKLNTDDYVVSARLVPSDTKAIISISGNGLFKQTPFTEFTTQGKNTKGAKLQKLTEGDFMADFYPLTTESDLLFASTRSCIRLSVAEVPTYSTGAQGNKSIKLSPMDNIVKITNC